MNSCTAWRCGARRVGEDLPIPQAGHDAAAIAGELVGEILGIADAEDLGRRVEAQTPGRKGDRGHQGFQVPWGQVDRALRRHAGGNRAGQVPGAARSCGGLARRRLCRRGFLDRMAANLSRKAAPCRPAVSAEVRKGRVILHMVHTARARPSAVRTTAPVRKGADKEQAESGRSAH